MTDEKLKTNNGVRSKGVHQQQQQQSPSVSTDFDRDKQIKYFTTCLKYLPQPYESLDTNRLTLVHFAIQAMDMLGLIDNDAFLAKCEIQKSALIDWVYNLQVPGITTTDDGSSSGSGFLGGTFLGPTPRNNDYASGHIAMAYTALSILTTLGDNLSRVNKEALIASLRSLQRQDGSFQCVSFGSEHDMRFVYCACAISHMLGDWSGVDKEKAVEFVRACRGYDGGISLIPGQEGHGGSTFCAVASLTLLKRLDVLEEGRWRLDLIRWCVHRQVGGMQGRPNKDEDTCYSYWIGGTLYLLGKEDLLEQESLRQFVFACQHPKFGGFSKFIGGFPDVLHSFYGLAWVDLSSKFFGNDVRLKKLNCTLGICQERADVFEGTIDMP